MSDERAFYVRMCYAAGWFGGVMFGWWGLLAYLLLWMVVTVVEHRRSALQTQHGDTE